MNKLITILIVLLSNIGHSQCITGTPPTLTCGTPISVADGTPSGQYGTASQSAPACRTNEKYTYADLYQVTYQPGMIIDVDCEGLLGFLEVLSADGCTSYNCHVVDASGVNISGESFVRDGGSQNGLLRFTIGLDDLGLTAGDTYLIKYTSIANCGGSPCTSATVGTARAYTISCHTVLANSCENGVVMSGDDTYSITNEYASDNGADLNGAGIDCGFSIEDNLMYRWCTDASNTAVTIDISSLTIVAGSSIQFAVLTDDCGGNFNDIQCNSGISTSQQILIDNTNTTASTCYWLSFDGNAGTWFTADITLLDAAPLPVELIYIRGKSMVSFNRLDWATSTEINADYYLIQRSKDTYDWTDMAKVKAIGNSTQKVTYWFKDYKIKDELYYYRIKQFDFDGKYETFRTIVIDNREDYKHRKLLKVTNATGQEVSDDYKGFKIYIYDDGFVKKSF